MSVAQFKSLVRRLRSRSFRRNKPIDEQQAGWIRQVSSPVQNYYRNKTRTHLASFYRFALQTRSLEIRDVFAKAASTQGLDLADLLAAIDYSNNGVQNSVDTSALAAEFDGPTLLALADLLSNTARDALDTHSALKIYEFVRLIDGDAVLSDENKLQMAEGFNEVGLYERAQELAAEFQINNVAPLQQELLNIQAVRRYATGDEEWLHTLNKLYDELGMTQVSLLGDTSLPLLDRLTSASSEPVYGPLVSVIMPTFSPGPGVRTAIRSLLEQTWQNLEIIVVNDASPREHRPVFDELELLDSRIRVLHQSENAGAYVARNAGLAVATGEFVTTHDDDDWSHPDKITHQVQTLINNTALMATTSAHIRTTQELDFRRVNARATFLQMNYSSLMFRRSLVREMGPWDTVNRGGDSEFYSRLLEYSGTDSVLGLTGKPLSFSRVWDGSLTSGEMSRGFFGYSRMLYRWAFRQWHRAKANSGEKAVREADDIRPYAIPTSFEPGKRNESRGDFDVIYVTDFFRQAKFVNYVLDEMETLSQEGLRVAYLHLYSPETNYRSGFPERLFDLQLEGRITQLAEDDIAETTLLLIYDASIGMFVDRIRSSIRCQHGVVIDHDLPFLSGIEVREPTYYLEALRNLDDTFGMQSQIVGATPENQTKLVNNVPAPRILPHKYIWRSHLRGDPAKIRMTSGHKPVVGFHAFNNIYRWPATAETLRDVYCSSAFRTRFLGNADGAIAKFGVETFDGIEIVDPSSEEETEFLTNIDFWISWPHPRLLDRVWEPVLQAMHAGTVVILPKHLESIYGEAALYAEVDEIEAVVTNYWTDKERYIEQATRAQQFIDSEYTAKRLVTRISKLLALNT